MPDKPIVYGKNVDPVGRPPAIVLINPKYPHNVGAVVRAASCYGISQVWFTGDRVSEALTGKKRLPREERMKGYGDVDLINFDYPLDAFPPGTVPIAVELGKDFVPLPFFVYPKNEIYVFGPEDGSIPSTILGLCHHHVYIPSYHCLNLAAAVYTILYDRMVTRFAEGQPLPTLNEQRGYVCDAETGTHGET